MTLLKRLALIALSWLWAEITLPVRWAIRASVTVVLTLVLLRYGFGWIVLPLLRGILDSLVSTFQHAIPAWMQHLLGH